MGNEQAVVPGKVLKRQDAAQVMLVEILVTGQLDGLVLSLDELPQVLEAGARTFG